MQNLPKYDIPLHNRLGTEFLVMLVALMTLSHCLPPLAGLRSATSPINGHPVLKFPDD